MSMHSPRRHPPIHHHAAPPEHPDKYSARYLVLFEVDDPMPRAALFDRDQRLLAEMVEPDPFTLDALVHGSHGDNLPGALAQAITELDERANPLRARCFELN